MGCLLYGGKHEIMDVVAPAGPMRYVPGRQVTLWFQGFGSHSSDVLHAAIPTACNCKRVF
jgi:hypothetical protein